MEFKGLLLNKLNKYSYVPLGLLYEILSFSFVRISGFSLLPKHPLLVLTMRNDTAIIFYM